jgi:hypothetical protein
MVEIRNTFTFPGYTVNGESLNTPPEFIVFNWLIDDGVEYYELDSFTRNITSLGTYSNYYDGPEYSNRNGRGLLLVKFV